MMSVEFASDTKRFCIGAALKLRPRQPGAVDCGGQSTEVSAAENRRIQDIDRLVVETFEDCARKILVRIEDQSNRAQIRPTVRSRRRTRWAEASELRYWQMLSYYCY